jgi:hypothetical protein
MTKDIGILRFGVVNFKNLIPIKYFNTKKRKKDSQQKKNAGLKLQSAKLQNALL